MTTGVGVVDRPRLLVATWTEGAGAVDTAAREKKNMVFKFNFHKMSEKKKSTVINYKCSD